MNNIRIRALKLFLDSNIPDENVRRDVLAKYQTEQSPIVTCVSTLDDPEYIYFPDMKSVAEVKRFDSELKADVLLNEALALVKELRAEIKTMKEKK